MFPSRCTTVCAYQTFKQMRKTFFLPNIWLFVYWIARTMCVRALERKCCLLSIKAVKGKIHKEKWLKCRWNYCAIFEKNQNGQREKYLVRNGYKSVLTTCIEFLLRSTQSSVNIIAYTLTQKYNHVSLSSVNRLLYIIIIVAQTHTHSRKKRTIIFQGKRINKLYVM